MFESKERAIQHIEKNIREATRWTAEKNSRRGRRQVARLKYMEAIREKLLSGSDVYGHYAYEN